MYLIFWPFAASDTASPYLFVNGNTMPHTSALARFAEPFAAVLEPESPTSRAGPAKPKAIQPHENAQLRPETTPWGLWRSHPGWEWPCTTNNWTDPFQEKVATYFWVPKYDPIPTYSQRRPGCVPNGRTSQVVGLFGLGRSAIDTSLCC